MRFPDSPLAFQMSVIIVLKNQIIFMGDIMAKKTFTVVIEKDPESGWLVGEVVELPGCYSQAPDIAALETNMREAIKAYLQARIVEEPLSSFVGTWQVEVQA
jgi:predicted RNase H-like HicB family nuclease